MRRGRRPAASASDRRPASAATTRTRHRPVDARTGTRQQPARAMARRLFLILIPVGLVPFRAARVAAAPIEVPIVILGRRIPCHCLSIQAPDRGIDRRRDRSRRRESTLPAPALPPYLECSCCSSFRPGSAFNEQMGWCVEFLVTILRRRQNCPAEGANPAHRTRAAIPLWLTRRKRRKEGVCPRNPERNRPKRPPASDG